MPAKVEVRFEAHHLDLEERVRRFAREAIEPVEARGEPKDLAEEDARAREFVRLLAREGLLSFVAPDAAGGRPRFDGRALCLIREHLARASGFCDCMFAMQGLGSAPVTLFGRPDQRELLLPRVVSGEVLAAFALTEPGAGSDVGALSLSAVRDGDHYTLSGEKTLISNAGVAGSYVVFARTDPDARRRGISAFLVPADAPGLSVAKRQRPMAPHPLGRLRFENCRVPAAARLGAEGDGFEIAMRTLDVFRVTVGAAALGMARRALSEAIRRARERVQFGKPIGEHQAIQFRLAEMATRFEAARLLVYRAATLADEDEENTTREASMAKLAATESAFRIIDQAVQIFGGEGVLRGFVTERLYREVRALRIYEGTTEIQHLVIGRALLKDDPDY